MRFREKLGLNVAPIALRIMLGVTFVWAGLGKVLVTMPVEGADAALLANLGVIRPAMPASVTPPQPPPTPPGSTETTPGESPPAGTGGGGLSRVFEPAVRILAVQGTVGPYSASDFQSPVEVRRVHGITLGVARAADPGNGENGAPKRRLLPGALGRGRWPALLAWAASLAELLGGFFVLLGLFTRLWAIALVWVMGVAMWLSQIGPALQNGTARWGFIPGYDPFDGAAWATPLWQLALLTSALALALIGPGAAALDRLIFRGARDDEGDDHPPQP